MNARGLLLIIAYFLLSSPAVKAQLTSNELRVEYDSAWTFKNLQLIPVKFRSLSGYGTRAGLQPALLFGDALSSRKLRLQEIAYENGADVNWLQVTNHSKQAVLVHSGDIVAGGKQDRMMAETKLLEPGATDYLKVFCVEKHRWDEKPRPFREAGTGDAGLIRIMNRSSRQSDVWREIDRRYAWQHRAGSTWSYLQLYRDSLDADSAYVRFFKEKYARSDSNLAGFLFITGNVIIATELFSSAEWVALSFENMLRSYIRTAVLVGDTPSIQKPLMSLFMNKIIISEAVQKNYVARYGKLHYYKEKIIHLVAYPE